MDSNPLQVSCSFIANIDERDIHNTVWLPTAPSLHIRFLALSDCRSFTFSTMVFGVVAT